MQDQIDNLSDSVNAVSSKLSHVEQMTQRVLEASQSNQQVFGALIQMKHQLDSISRSLSDHTPNPNPGPSSPSSSSVPPSSSSAPGPSSTFSPSLSVHPQSSQTFAQPQPQQQQQHQQGSGYPSVSASPYPSPDYQPRSQIDEDERMAKQLQEELNAAENASASAPIAVPVHGSAPAPGHSIIAVSPTMGKSVTEKCPVCQIDVAVSDIDNHVNKHFEESGPAGPTIPQGTPHAVQQQAEQSGFWGKLFGGGSKKPQQVPVQGVPQKIPPGATVVRAGKDGQLVQIGTIPQQYLYGGAPGGAPGQPQYIVRQGPPPSQYPMQQYPGAMPQQPPQQQQMYPGGQPQYPQQYASMPQQQPTQQYYMAPK